MVKAMETSLRELLEGTKQYQVPLYQRRYSWRKDNLTRLWDDVLKLTEDRNAHGPDLTHFMGSLVLAPTPHIGPAGVARYLVVDGQQRLTTLTLLLAAIRDHRAETEGDDHRRRLNDLYLTNPWRPQEDRLKLVPTQADRVAYQGCIESAHQAGGADPVGEAYRYFRGMLAEHDDIEDEQDIEKLEESVLSGLTLVAVTTSHEDNVHRIFESLNNTGLKLTQGDLLRNYLFMRLPTRGPVVYDTQWLPLQGRLSDDQLELLFWLDMVQVDDSVGQRDTYQAQVSRLDRLPDEAAIEKEVARFNRLSALVERILRPETEPNGAVRERLTRLNAWGTTTVYPLLLHLLDRRASGRATDDEIARAMLIAESYLVRRVLIGKATMNVNRILLRAVPEIKDTSPADGALRSYLSTGRKFFATDEQIRAAVATTPLYYSGRSTQRKLLLSWLEQTFGSKEPVDPKQCTIEHVMPQTSTDGWLAMLAAGLDDTENPREIYDSLLHTVGNLTLTGYNSSLGNKPFGEKREAYAASGFQMNHEIATYATWGRQEILSRAAKMAERVISYWPGPEGDGVEPLSEAWGLMDRALAELPAGTWTTYGAVAQLIGSHPVPVGQRIANHHVPNGHRVLQSGGTVSLGFRWIESDRTDSQREALEAEGVVFDSSGKADPDQQVSAEELAALAGVDLERGPLLADTKAEADQRIKLFYAQLAENQNESVTHGVLATLDAWVTLGGFLSFGRADETSCFLMCETSEGQIWPAAIYPSGKFEVVFQYLKDRSPFDDIENREEFRRRLNLVPGVELPASKIALRPGFDLELLDDPKKRAPLVDALRWFVEVCRQP